MIVWCIYQKDAHVIHPSCKKRKTAVQKYFATLRFCFSLENVGPNQHFIGQKYPWLYVSEFGLSQFVGCFSLGGYFGYFNVCVNIED